MNWAKNAGEVDGPTPENEQITDLPDSPRSKHRKGFEMTHIIVRPLQTNVQGGEGTGYRAKPA